MNTLDSNSIRGIIPLSGGIRSDRNILMNERSGADYTGQYAELASPVPSHVNLDELVESLRAASNHP